MTLHKQSGVLIYKNSPMIILVYDNYSVHMSRRFEVKQHKLGAQHHYCHDDWKMNQKSY